MSTALESSIKEGVRMARFYMGAKKGLLDKKGRSPGPKTSATYKAQLRMLLDRMGKKFERSIPSLYQSIEREALRLGPSAPKEWPEALGRGTRLQDRSPQVAAAHRKWKELDYTGDEGAEAFGRYYDLVRSYQDAFRPAR